MQKKMVVIIIGLVVLLGMTFFGYVIFSKKKIVNITVQNPISEIAQENNVDVQNTTEKAEENLIVQNEPENIDIQENKKTTSSQTQSNSETKSSNSKIVDRFISWGFQKSSDRKIDTIIIHSTYDALGNDPYNIDGIIAEYKQYGVSPHYLIARDGATYHLVADKNIAYHAGVSKMPDGSTNVNDFSIGIELANTTDGKFTDDQYNALNRLIGDLKKQYSIKYILGHSDIAPGRKTDPWNINWDKVSK